MIKWFASVGEINRAVWLVTDLEKLRADPTYGHKCFLLYANQRQGAARGYGVAGIKAVAVCEREGRQLSEVQSIFGELYEGKKNITHIAALDPRLADLDVPSIVASVEEGNLSRAFDAITLRGCGQKVKSFFLRDIATSTKAENADWDLENQYLFCQPIDTWVRGIAGCFDHELRNLPRLVRRHTGYGFTWRPDYNLAVSIIEMALAADVSPLNVNQGMWYFARHGVADMGRLRKLIEHGSAKTLQAELDLMRGFADLA
jgi:hypothetical protein